MTNMQKWKDAPARMYELKEWEKAMSLANTKMYTTRSEFHEEAAQAIENSGAALAAEYDMENIVDDNLKWDQGAQKFFQHTTAEEFWQSVERHALTEFELTFSPNTEDDQEIEGNTVGLMYVIGFDEGIVDTVQYSTPTPEEWEPTVYAEALQRAGWEPTEFHQDQPSTVTRKDS